MTLQREQQSIHTTLVITGKDGQLLLKKLQSHYQMPNTELNALSVKTKYFSVTVDVVLSDQHQVEDCQSRYLIFLVDQIHDDQLQKLTPLLESQDCIIVCKDVSKFDQSVDSGLHHQIYDFNEDFTSIVDALECHLADMILDQQQQQQSDLSGDEVEEEPSVEIQKDQRVDEQEDDDDSNLEHLVKQARQFREDYQDKLDMDARHAQAEKLLGKLLSQSGFQFN